MSDSDESFRSQDPWLGNIDADMTAWLLLEAALCICEDEHDPNCPFCFG